MLATMSARRSLVRLQLQPKASQNVALTKRLLARRDTIKQDKNRMQAGTGRRDCEFDCVWFVHGSPCCEKGVKKSPEL